MSCTNNAQIPYSKCYYENNDGDEFMYKIQTKTKTNFKTKIIMKVTHYKIRNNGSRRRKKAKYIGAYFYGLFNKGSECTSSSSSKENTNDYDYFSPRYNKKTDKSKLKLGVKDTVSFLKNEFFYRCFISNKQDNQIYDSHTVQIGDNGICKNY
jgi:hypothetical protein